MRVLMVARRYPPDVQSGTETVFQNLYRQARVQHHVRLLVGFRRSRSLLPRQVVAVDLRKTSRIGGYAALWRAAAREQIAFKPDVVLSNSIEVPVLGLPTVCIVHDLNFGGGGGGVGGLARRAYYRAKARRFAAVVTVSEAMKGELARVGLPRERLHAIRNGVDLERFRPVERSAGGRIVLACISRILPGKGQHVVVEALARLPEELRSRTILRVVGPVEDQGYLEELRRRARDLPVEFHLDVPDVVPMYQGADVVLFPTVMSEGFGLIAVEAMACGRPVIHADQDAIVEASGGHGVAVAGGDVEAWAEAMARLVADRDLREELGARGRRWVVDQADWSRTWARYEELLAKVARVGG